MVKIFFVFLRLGLTSFGGPVAHLAFFRTEFVERRQWISEKDYADLVALCQFLPGPASSQVGLAVGYYQRSYAGALAAWFGFTLPSALLMMMFAIGINQYQIPLGALQGLKLVAIAVVAQAIWAMGRSFCGGLWTLLIALGVTLILVLFPSLLVQFAVILVAAIVGVLLFTDKSTSVLTKQPEEAKGTTRESVKAKPSTILMLLVFLGLLVAMPILAASSGHEEIILFDIFYRVGSTVFGGGHVVLPMLQAELAPNGLVAADQFLAGYGAAQAVPGPLFTFAAFLGSATPLIDNPWLGGLLCLVAIFLPSFLMVLACLPYWEVLRHYSPIQSALVGINAAVVGILAATFIKPLVLTTVSSVFDVAFVVIVFVALQRYKLPPWLLVIVGALVGTLFTN